MRMGLGNLQKLWSTCKIFVWPLALLSLCLQTGSLKAQVTTASIYGNVIDSSGAVVSHATVTMTDTATNITTTQTTNEAGEYRFDLMPVGTYSMAVTAPGFKKFVQPGITLTVSQNQRLDATLNAGSVTETVTVTSEPPQLDLESAVVVRTLESR